MNRSRGARNSVDGSPVLVVDAAEFRKISCSRANVLRRKDASEQARRLSWTFWFWRAARGGAGKSTLAAHIGVAAEADGCGPVALIDTDPQATVADWWNVRKEERPSFVNTDLGRLPSTIEALAQSGCRLAVIDTPPSVTEHIRSVVGLATYVLIPVKPSPNDLRAVGKTVDIVEAARVPFGFALTQAKQSALLTAQAVAALSAFGTVAPAIIGDRVDFASSMVDGRTVQELAPRSKSAAEIAELWRFVRGNLHGLTKARKRAK